MFKPSPILGARLRLTTKQVNGGYYKGNRTGSMGAHTEYGGYIIDYRKVRHFDCPDLTNFQLTPFVTQQMEPTKRTQTRPDGTTFRPKFVDGMQYLQRWRTENPGEFDYVLKTQREQDEEQAQAQAQPGEKQLSGRRGRGRRHNQVKTRGRGRATSAMNKAGQRGSSLMKRAEQPRPET